MLFGFTNAPATFQGYINGVLREHLNDFVSAYADDVIIYSSGFLEDRRHKVGKVLQKPIDAGPQLDVKKCEFESKQMKYLGHIISAARGVMMDPEKTRAIREWATPRQSAQGSPCIPGIRKLLPNVDSHVLRSSSAAHRAYEEGQGISLERSLWSSIREDEGVPHYRASSG